MKPFYEQDGITIYHGDCREVLPSLPAFDVCFTSPPYGDLRDYGAPIDDWDALLVTTIQALDAKEDGQVFVNLGPIYRDGCLWEYWRSMIESARAHGWRLFAQYVWDKGFAMPGDWGGRLAPAHEFIFHFNRKARTVAKTKRCVRAGDVTGRGQRKQDGSVKQFSHAGRQIQEMKVMDSVIRLTPHQARNGYEMEHPAVFPLTLPSEFIAAFSAPGDLILDPFMGSGSTLRAAKDSGRKAIGIEIEERYCEIAAKRMAQQVLDFATA